MRFYLLDDTETNLMSELRNGREEVVEVESLNHVASAWTVTRNSNFWQRIVFICFVWMPEYTAVIFLNFLRI